MSGGTAKKRCFSTNCGNRHGTALALRQPLKLASLPASQAVLGKTGPFLGRDYRGLEVLADLRPVPGTPWYMVTKVDTSEILEEVRYRAVVVGFAVVLLILGAAGMTAYFHRTERDEERLRAAEALRESEDKFRYLFDHSVIGKSITRPSGELSVNEALAEMLGYSRDDLQRVRWQDVTHPDDIEMTQRHIESLLAGEVDSVRFAKRFIHRDGSVVWGDLNSSLRRDKGGKPQYLMTAIVDVTGRHKAEEALRQRNEELVRFAYTVSHDLKSPLVTIRTFLGYLEHDMEAADSARVETDMGHMRGAAEKMSRLLDELLELSRVGRKMNSPEGMTLQTVVGEALDLVAGSVAERGARVEVTDKPVVLRGDRTRLVEVFQNLLDKRREVHGRPAPAAGGSWRRPDRERNRPFRPRQRHGHRPASPVQTFRLVRETAPRHRRHGHRPRARQANRRGPWRTHLGRIGRTGPRRDFPLHFGRDHGQPNRWQRRFQLPRTFQPGAPHREKPGVPHGRRNRGYDMIKGNPVTILLVEDDPAHAEIVRRNLGDFRVANRLIHVGDGQEALDYLRREGRHTDPEFAPRPDLILLDLRLPKVDGLEVLRHIKGDPDLANIPTVVLTTSSADGDMVEAYETGACSYLVKPVDFLKFAKLLEAFGFYWLAWNQFPLPEGVEQP